jgi:hypothetical protein
VKAKLNKFGETEPQRQQRHTVAVKDTKGLAQKLSAVELNRKFAADPKPRVVVDVVDGMCKRRFVKHGQLYDPKLGLDYKVAVQSQGAGGEVGGEENHHPDDEGEVDEDENAPLVVKVGDSYHSTGKNSTAYNTRIKLPGQKSSYKLNIPNSIASVGVFG